MFDCNLLFFPCRHHIFALELRSTFDVLIDVSSGLNVILFKGFRESWSTIDKTKYRSSIEDVTKDVRVDMIKFLQEQLCQKQHRDDYRKLLALAMMFFGDPP